MGNVHLPTPVALAGGALCVLGGYLLGVVAGPQTPELVTATVQGYDQESGRLCLRGEAVADMEAATDGRMCGQWRPTQGSDTLPEPGDAFRFVTVTMEGSREPGSDQTAPVILIYGEVV